ncbi:MAG: DUF4402 domain-containing protein [Mariniphaga sp.]
MNATELFKHLKSGLITSIILCCCVGFSFAQPVLPQRTITIYAAQGIHFGTFCLTGSAGGTVIVGWDGSRSSTGSIGLLNITPTAHPAIFEIKLCEGRTVNIDFQDEITLSDGNTGTLTLNLGPTEKGVNHSTFFTNSDCNFVTPLRVGGTLHIPGNAIPGTYSGSFSITFNQQ